MSARQRAVEVIARRLILNSIGDYIPADTPWAVLYERGIQNGGVEMMTEILKDAEAIVAALEADMGLRTDTRPMQHEGDTFADSCVRNSLAAAFQKWPDFAHEERLVTDWIEVTP